MFDPSSAIQDFLVFGEFGDVNPSISDSSTFTFLDPKTMKESFEKDVEGCFLYSRHWNPTNKYLAQALAALEGSEAAQVTASGMAAISSTLMQLCGMNDEIVSSRTIYGGTYALMKNFLPRFGIRTRFVNITDLAAVEAAITPRTKVIYCEAVSNPLLEVADLPALAQIANQYGLKLVVDNTFSPMTISPIRLGAHIVIHSLTKYINGTSDCIAGCICSTAEFIDALSNVNSGATMLLGPVLDAARAASILKNLHSLHIRMKQHSANAAYVTERLQAEGVIVHYPGLPNHPGHATMKRIMNPAFGFGGMFTIDAGSEEKADALMQMMQMEKVGYLAVSLGYFKTLFSAPGTSTSSEIPAEEQAAMGLTKGLIRFSIGLDNDIARTYERIMKCVRAVGVLPEPQRA
jgi:methionine-gamma-lyase